MPEYDDSSAAVLDVALTRVADRYSPTAPPAFTDLLSRRRRRTAWRAGGAVGVAAVTVGALALGPGMPFTGAAVDPASTTPEEHGPLVSSGECSGLTVTALWQGTPERTPLSIGRDAAANVVTMPANSLLYIEADGPCVDRLRLETDDGALLRGTSSTELNAFDATGLSSVITQPGLGGRATIELHLEGDDQPIAELTIEITASAPEPTVDPTHTELGAATWTLASSPAPTDTSVALLVEETACASGQSAEGRIVSGVQYTPTEVIVDISVRTRPGDQDCQGNPQTPYVLELTEPVGDRVVVPAE